MKDQSRTRPVKLETSDFTEFVNILNREEDYNSLFEKISEFFNKLGAAATNIGIFDNKTKNIVGMNSNMHQDWLDYYVDRQFMHSDPIIRLFQCNSTPYAIGFGAERRAFLADGDEEELYDHVSEAGYPNMMVVPVTPPGAAYSAAVAIANGMSGRDAIAFRQSFGSLISLAAMAAGQRAIELFAPDRSSKDWLGLSPPLLSQREREVVCWLASGLRTDQIAFRLNIKPVTVHLHVASARKKLAARTREQLVANALLKRLI